MVCMAVLRPRRPRRTSPALAARCLADSTQRTSLRCPSAQVRGRPMASRNAASGRLTPTSVASEIHSHERGFTSMR